MRQYVNENMGAIGAFSGFWAWLNSIYPVIKGFVGEVSFWAGVILCVLAVADRFRKPKTK